MNHFRPADPEDAPVLAAMNQQLIRDEGHRNRMTLPELTARMQKWLAGESHAVVFEHNGAIAGYALYRLELDHVYLRQLFVDNAHRRQGIARAAIAWLRENPWKAMTRIRVEVLIGNRTGIEFWHAVGFEDYSMTMELER